jgi:hypothetical protein
MPRRPRIFVEGAISHVYNRSARGEGVFGDPEEAIEFVERLREADQEFSSAVKALDKALSEKALEQNRTKPVVTEESG